LAEARWNWQPVAGAAVTDGDGRTGAAMPAGRGRR